MAMADIMVHLKRIKNKVIRLLTRRKKRIPLDVFMEVNSPVMMDVFKQLLRKQEVNGSWQNDPLLTASALRAIYYLERAIEIQSPIFKKRYYLAVLYLKRWLLQITDRILMQDTIYYELDRVGRAFYNTILTFSIIGEESCINNDRVVRALQKLVNCTAKYCFKLHNPFLVEELLMCLSSIYDYVKMTPPDVIIDYAVLTVFSEGVDNCVFFALVPALLSWYVRFPSVIERAWKKYKGTKERTTFSKALAKRMRTHIDELLTKNEIDTRLLAYVLLFLAYAKELMKQDLLLKMAQRLITFLQKRYLIQRTRIEQNAPAFYLALIGEGLLRTGLHKWYVISNEHIKAVKIALRKFFEIKKLSKHVLIFDVIAMALACMAIILWLYFSFPSVLSFIGVVLSIFSIIVSIIAIIRRRINRIFTARL